MTSPNRSYETVGRLIERMDAGLVPAGVVRGHLAELERDGILHEYVHHYDIGVSADDVASIVGGARDTTREVAQAILKLRPETAFPVRALVSARGAQRRVQALIVHGWSLGQVAGFLGVHQSELSNLLHPTCTEITLNKHVSIARMYRQREMQVPREKHPRSVSRARRDGWIGGLAWKDIDRDEHIARAARPRAYVTTE